MKVTSCFSQMGSCQPCMKPTTEALDFPFYLDLAAWWQAPPPWPSGRSCSWVQGPTTAQCGQRWPAAAACAGQAQAGTPAVVRATMGVSGEHQPEDTGHGAAMQMAQGSSYRKIAFARFFESDHTSLALEPPADAVRRGLGRLQKPPRGFPLNPVYCPSSGTGDGGRLRLSPEGCVSQIIF